MKNNVLNALLKFLVTFVCCEKEATDSSVWTFLIGCCCCIQTFKIIIIVLSIVLFFIFSCIFGMISFVLSFIFSLYYLIQINVKYIRENNST